MGNDVVDLRESESRLGSLHPRFVERVFTEEERRRIFSSVDPQAALWTYWAAKESAYKVVCKIQGAAIFSPSTYAVEIHHDFSGGRLTGWVDHDGQHLHLEITRNEAWVHALAMVDAGASGAARVLSEVAPAPARRDPSTAVRAAAASALSRRLGVAAGALAIPRATPPRLEVRGQRTGVDLSLSHHGRWLAFAAVLPCLESLEGSSDLGFAEHPPLSVFVRARCP